MNLSPYLALEASAGSGKTFALSVRYLSLLFMGANPQKIVALTFTNKSAAEMKTRIFETLKHLESKDELSAISLQTGKSKETLLAEKERVMQTLLQADIKISTLDSFFSLILRHFALHVGLQPDFRVGQNGLDEVDVIMVLHLQGIDAISIPLHHQFVVRPLIVNPQRKTDPGKPLSLLLNTTGTNRGK